MKQVRGSLLSSSLACNDKPIEWSLLNMINEKKNVKFFQQSKDGRAELVNTKFLD